MNKHMESPLSIYYKTRHWLAIEGTKETKEKIEILKKLATFPNKLIPKKIKDEIYGIVLYNSGDIFESYKIIKKIYDTYGSKDMYWNLMLVKVALECGYDNFFSLNDKLRSLAKDTEIVYYLNLKNFNTLNLANHVEARRLASVVNEITVSHFNHTIQYLYSDIDEPMVKKIEGPVYTYNNIILKDKTVLVLGTNKDELIIGNDKVFKLDNYIEMPEGENFYYCNPVWRNHYHMLIEHIPVYNYIATRFPHWNYYKNICTSDTPENNYNGFKPIKNNTFYLHKNGFYTFVLPRTKVPTLFDTYRPPDIILQEYREVMRDIMKSIESPRNIIYLRRTGPRSIDYDEYMIQTLKNIYPELIVFTGLEKDNQADVFVNAKMIFGPHGAGFSNMLYCPDDCIIYEIGMDVPDNFFGSLARTFKLKYYKDPELKVRYGGKIYLDKEKSDLIILNIQRLLGDAVPHITCDSF